MGYSLGVLVLEIQVISSTHSIRLEVIRAWVDHKWKFPLVRGLLHAATTAAAKDEAKKEKVEVSHCF